MNFDKDKIKSMVSDMEDVEKLVGNKGRFVCGMVHIPIKDLAACSREALRAQTGMGGVEPIQLMGYLEDQVAADISQSLYVEHATVEMSISQRGNFNTPVYFCAERKATISCDVIREDFHAVESVKGVLGNCRSSPRISFERIKQYVSDLEDKIHDLQQAQPASGGDDDALSDLHRRHGLDLKKLQRALDKCAPASINDRYWPQRNIMEVEGEVFGQLERAARLYKMHLEAAQRNAGGVEVTVDEAMEKMQPYLQIPLVEEALDYLRDNGLRIIPDTAAQPAEGMGE